VKRRIIAGFCVFAGVAGTLWVCHVTPSWRTGVVVWAIAVLWVSSGWLIGWSMTERLPAQSPPAQPSDAQIPEGDLHELQPVEDLETKEISQEASQFLRHLMHELKRPVASLQQAVYLLSDETPGPLTAQQRQILGIQLRSANRILSCIENLGDLFQLEGGAREFRLESQDLVPLIGEVVRRFDVLLRERQLQVKVEFSTRPLLADCDKTAISRAIGHVLENAIKFSPIGKTINIRAEHVIEVPARSPQLSVRSEPGPERGFVLITVADSGPGIPESRRETIFEKFYQIKDNSDAYHQGLGIGLTICRAILKAHHGTVWVENSPSGGSLFSLVLPVATSTNALAYCVKSVS
jgi:signal transduction histidine kinase